jgi:hypothetical protein
LRSVKKSNKRRYRERVKISKKDMANVITLLNEIKDSSPARFLNERIWLALIEYNLNLPDDNELLILLQKVKQKSV